MALGYGRLHFTAAITEVALVGSSAIDFAIIVAYKDTLDYRGLPLSQCFVEALVGNRTYW